VIMREVVNGLMYILSTGCQWRAKRPGQFSGIM
jgi:transposase